MTSSNERGSANRAGAGGIVVGYDVAEGSFVVRIEAGIFVIASRRLTASSGDAAGGGAADSDRGAGEFVSGASRAPPSARRGLAAARQRPFAAEQADDLVRRRQVGGVGEADQHHLGGSARVCRLARLLAALEQHLPGARQKRRRQLAGDGGGAALLLGAQALAAGIVADGLDARGRVHRFGEIAEQLHRLGAVAMQVIERGQRRLGVAAEHVLEQIEDAPAVGEAEHVAHRLGAHLALAHGDRLIEQRQAVAHRALGGAGDERQRVVLRRWRLRWRRSS